MERNKRCWLRTVPWNSLAALLLVLAASGYAPVVQAQEAGLLLPDLQTLPPSELTIQVISSSGKKVLRLTNSIANLGTGALELVGVSDPVGGQTWVTQNIYLQNGGMEKRDAGVFVYHPGHHHWHFENFVRYELWTLRTDGAFASMVAVSDKVSYCLRDNSRAKTTSPDARMRYIICDQALQGISPGWIDTYRFDRPGQMVDISGQPDGRYALRSIVDPTNQIVELNETNNAATVYIDLLGRQVRLVEPDHPFPPGPE